MLKIEARIGGTLELVAAGTGLVLETNLKIIKTQTKKQHFEGRQRLLQ